MYRKVKLSEIGALNRGKSKHRPRNDEILFGGDYPFIQTGDIKKAKWKITEYSDTYNEIGLAQSRLWGKNTLCITIAANIADTAILDFPACFPDSVLGFIPDEEIANVYYIDYVLRKYKSKLEKSATKTAQMNINLGTFERLEINIPDINEQNRIVNMITPFDEKILLNEKLIKSLEIYISNLYVKWFVEYNFPDINGNPFKDVGGSFVDFKGQLIPENWLIKPFSTLIRKTGKSVKEKSEWRSKKLIDASNMSSFTISLNDFSLGEEMNTNIFTVEKGDILFNSIRAYLGKMVISPFDGVRTGTLHAIKSIEKKYEGFVLCTMMQRNFFNNAILKSKGTKMPVIDFESLFSMNIVVPKDEIVISKFSEISNIVFEKIINLTNENFSLSETRDLMIKKLLK